MNIMANSSKIWAPFTLMIVNSIIVYLHLYKFWQEANFYEYTYNDRGFISRGDYKLHAILIRGIPNYVSVNESSQII